MFVTITTTCQYNMLKAIIIIFSLIIFSCGDQDQNNIQNEDLHTTQTQTHKGNKNEVALPIKSDGSTLASNKKINNSSIPYKKVNNKINKNEKLVIIKELKKNEFTVNSGGIDHLDYDYGIYLTVRNNSSDPINLNTLKFNIVNDKEYKKILGTGSTTYPGDLRYVLNLGQKYDDIRKIPEKFHLTDYQSSSMVKSIPFQLYNKSKIIKPGEQFTIEIYSDATFVDLKNATPTFMVSYGDFEKRIKIDLK